MRTGMSLPSALYAERITSEKPKYKCTKLSIEITKLLCSKAASSGSSASLSYSSLCEPKLISSLLWNETFLG
jgi:hypothetical protein